MFIQSMVHTLSSASIFFYANAVNRRLEYVQIGIYNAFLLKCPLIDFNSTYDYDNIRASNCTSCMVTQVRDLTFDLQTQGETEPETCRTNQIIGFRNSTTCIPTVLSKPVSMASSLMVTVCQADLDDVIPQWVMVACWSTIRTAVLKTWPTVDRA